MDHGKPIIYDFLIMNRRSSGYALLRRQFELATRYYQYLLEIHTKIAAGDSWSPPSADELGTNVKAFRSQHPDASYVVLRSVNRFAATVFRRYMRHKKRDRYMRVSSLDRFLLTVGKRAIRRPLADGSVSVHETGTLKFRTKAIADYERQHGLPRETVGVHIAGVGVLVVRVTEMNPPEDYEHKHWLIVRSDGRIYLRAIYGPKGKGVNPYV